MKYIQVCCFHGKPLFGFANYSVDIRFLDDYLLSHLFVEYMLATRLYVSEKSLNSVKDDKRKKELVQKRIDLNARKGKWIKVAKNMVIKDFGLASPKPGVKDLPLEKFQPPSK